MPPQRHQQFLTDGATRMGFFLGDGAGVGKGRQISGIILDNFARGRTKNVWFSTSTDLAKDAERDLRDLGCYVPIIDGCQALDKVGERNERVAPWVAPWGGHPPANPSYFTPRNPPPVSVCLSVR
jgi:hypothetical protein